MVNTLSKRVRIQVFPQLKKNAIEHQKSTKRATKGDYTNPQSGLGSPFALTESPSPLPVAILFTSMPTYASLLTGSPTVTDQVLSP